MKKNLLFSTLCLCLLFFNYVNAQNQECGTTSGPSVCTANNNLTTVGFFPNYDSLPCAIDGVMFDTVVQFHVPETYGSYTITSIQITSIFNFPCGMCWAMGETDNTISGGQSGCIRAQGITYDAPGQYKLRIYGKIKVDGLITVGPLSIDSLTGLKYYIRVRVPDGPCVLVDTLATGNTTSVSGNIAAASITGNTTVCQGGTTSLTVGGGAYYGYNWSNGGTTATISNVGAGAYSVTVYDNCNSTTTSVTVTTSTPTVNPTSTPDTICSGSSSTLAANATAGTGTISTYAWSSGISGNASGGSVTPTGTTTYRVTVTNSNSCSVTGTVSVAVNASPTAAPSATPTGICPGSSSTLASNATAGSGTISTYAWSSGLTGSVPGGSVSPGAGTTYTVTVTNSNNCSAAGSVSITVNAPPTLTASATPVAICAGDSSALATNATAGSGTISSYAWSSGLSGNVSGGKVSPANNATYTVTVTNSNNCTATASAAVNVNAIPTVAPSATPGAICTGGNSTLAANAAAGSGSISGYDWSSGLAGNTPVGSVSPGTSTTYTVTVTNSNNCTASGTASVTVNALPVLTPSATPGAVCVGDSSALSANASAGSGVISSYDWSSGLSGNVSGGKVSPANTTSYSVTVINSNNCSSSGTALVNVNANPSLTPAATPGAICNGGSSTLAANAVAGSGSISSYAWSSGLTGSVPGGSVSPVSNATYSVTVTNSNNCSATGSAAVTVNANPDDTVTLSGPTTFCSGDSVTLTAAGGLSYLWSNMATTQGITITQSGNYSVTVTNSNRCTAVSDTTAVTVNPATLIVTQPVDQSSCAGGDVTFSVSATGDNLSYQWLQNGDSILNANSSTYNIPSVSTADTGTYSVIVNGICGVDTSENAGLALASSIAFSQQPASQSVCLGNPVTFTVIANGANAAYQWQKNGQNINGNLASYIISSVAGTDTGSYTCYVTSSCGDSTSGAAVLTVNYPTYFAYSDTICYGQTYNFDGTVLSASGPYTDTLTNSVDCDSIITLQLTVSPFIGSSLYDTICNGNSYFFNGQNYTASGSYNDTVAVSGGCDSIITLNLMVNPPLTSDFAASICAGDSFNFKGQMLSVPGTYPDTLTTLSGCDSIVTLTLTVNQPSATSIAASTCSGSYNFNGTTLTTTGVYYDTLPNVNGCDSIVTLSLTVNTTIAFNMTDSICAGDSFVFEGQTLTRAGAYSDTVPGNGNSCDTIYNLNLTLNQLSATAFSNSICQGQSYSFGGQSLTNSGTYSQTYTNILGCDSVVTLTLTVNQPSTTLINASICSGSQYSFKGQNYDTTGTYTDTLTGSNTCDSIVILHLLVNTYVTSAFSDSICSGSAYSFNGRTLRTAGTYKDTLTAQGGCDSIVTLTLVLKQPVYTAQRASECTGGTYNFNGRSLTVAGTYRDTLTGINGCDSIVELNLQFNAIITDSFGASICKGSSYAFNGRTLDTAGIYADTLVAEGGCDSLVIVNLRVLPVTSSTLTAAICTGSTLNLNGRQYRSTGTYYDTITGSNGCDSIITINLQVSSTLYGTAAAAICQGSSYPLGNRTLTTPGVYYDTLTAQGGCDSIVTFTLTVNQPTSGTTNQALCTGDTLNFYGQMLTTAGTYTANTTNDAGCDSTLTLTLTVNSLPPVSWNVSDTLCNNGVDVMIPEGTPPGGKLSGTGVINQVLDQSMAGNGPYLITYTVLGSNGCDNSITKTFVLGPNCPPTGINELNLENAISLYPNPANDLLIAQSDFLINNNTTPVMYDVTGKQVVISFTREADKLIFNTAKLAAGMYWIRFDISGNLVSKRFVKIGE